LAISKTQRNLLEENRFSDAEGIKHARKNLTDIAVQDFKNHFEQRSKSREHCIEMERDLKNYRLLIPKLKRTKIRGLSLRANYTDRAIRRLSEKLVPTFADRGCHVVGVTDPYGSILGFLDRRLLIPAALKMYFFKISLEMILNILRPSR
jgi:CBS-domain-containing membrane protein